MSYAAIIVAAGRGTRAGGGVPKQWREIAGKPVARWTLERFADAHLVILVINDTDRQVASDATQGIDVQLVTGGENRAASVKAGLEAAAESGVRDVLIHDVARPCVTLDVIGNVLAALENSEAAAPALAVTDALWTGADGTVTGTTTRDGLFRAQTPQGFRLKAILAAHRAHDTEAADDVEVARRAGMNVAIVAGSEDNLKITGPEDFDRARAILERQNGHPPR